MSGMTFYQDFVYVLGAYAEDLISNRDDSPAIRWFKGEFDLKSDARRDLSIAMIK